MKYYINAAKLKNLTDVMCSYYGLSGFTRAQLDELYSAEVPQPLMLFGNGVTVWADKYYAAFQEGDSDVKYLYISALHIAEENSQLSRVNAARGREDTLPPDIALAFAKAEKMQVFQRGYVIDTQLLTHFLQKVSYISLCAPCKRASSSKRRTTAKSASENRLKTALNG